MDHSYYQDRISAYYDGQLPPQEREVVEQHLGECRECRNLLANLEKLDRLVEQHSQLGSGEYWEQSAKKIEQKLDFTQEVKAIDVTPSRWKGLAGKLAAVAASIAILAFIALYERDISKEISPLVLKSTQAPQVISKKEMPSLSKEGSYDEKATENKGTGAVIPVDERKAKVTVAQKDEAVTPEELIKKQATKPLPAQTVVEPIAEKVDVPSAELAVAEQGEGGIIAEETISVAEPQIAQEFPEFARIQADTMSTTQQTVSVVVSAPVLPDSWLQPVSLEQWRHRRDSLQVLYAELSSPHRELSEVKSRQKGGRPPVQQIEELLLHSYYQVARLTQDEKEQAVAISYLADYAKKTESRYRDQAQKYLKELESKRE